MARGMRIYCLNFKLTETSEWDEYGLYAYNKEDAIAKTIKKLTEEHGFAPYKVKPYLCVNKAHDRDWRIH